MQKIKNKILKKDNPLNLFWYETPFDDVGLLKLPQSFCASIFLWQKIVGIKLSIFFDFNWILDRKWQCFYAQQVEMIWISPRKLYKLLCDNHRISIKINLWVIVGSVEPSSYVLTLLIYWKQLRLVSVDEYLVRIFDENVNDFLGSKDEREMEVGAVYFVCSIFVSLLPWRANEWSRRGGSDRRQRQRLSCDCERARAVPPS